MRHLHSATQPGETAVRLARELVELIPVGSPGLFNPWRENCQEDLCNSQEEKIQRLAFHLDCEPDFILTGEAPGYQGARYSGVAFTSERLLLEGCIPRIPKLDQRLSKRARPFSEPSATIVWKTLYQLGIEHRTILWNAVQLHPYIKDTPWSNRTPTKPEIALGKPALQCLMGAFPSALIVAVGNNAKDQLMAMGIQPAEVVRHPANGGATRFAEELSSFVRNIG